MFPDGNCHIMMSASITMGDGKNHSKAIIFNNKDV